MSKRVSIFSNLVIAAVLLVLSLAVFTTDMDGIYTTVSAPIYSGNKHQKNISIMFNVGSGTSPEFIQPVMDILTDRGAGATFFVSGGWSAANMDLVRAISSAGFELGNHGYSGKNIKSMTASEQRAEIKYTHDLIKAITGLEMKLFTPPAGSFSKMTLKTAEELGYITVMWSKDIKTATKDPQNGDLVILYPCAEVISALPEIIEFYLSSGFAIVPASSNIIV